MTSGAHMYLPLYVCVCSACNRVILLATAVNGKFSMKTDEYILNLVFNMFVCYTIAFFMLLPTVTSFLSVALFPMQRVIWLWLILFVAACISWFILLTVSLEQFCEGQRQTHTKVCQAFSKFVATLLKYLDGTSLFSLHCTSLHFRSQHFKTLFFWLFRQICIILHARNTSKEIACKLKIDFRHISMLRKIFFEVLKVICIIYCLCCCCCCSWQLQSSISALESHKTFYRGNRPYKKNNNNC